MQDFHLWINRIRSRIDSHIETVLYIRRGVIWLERGFGEFYLIYRQEQILHFGGKWRWKWKWKWFKQKKWMGSIRWRGFLQKQKSNRKSRKKCSGKMNKTMEAILMIDGRWCEWLRWVKGHGRVGQVRMVALSITDSPLLVRFCCANVSMPRIFMPAFTSSKSCSVVRNVSDTNSVSHFVFVSVFSVSLASLALLAELTPKCRPKS